MYKAIIFDFFGVICPDVHVLWIEENGFSDSTDELIEKYYRYSDVGELSTKDLYKKLGTLVDRSAEQTETEIKSFERVNTSLVNLIKKLRQDYKIGLCSNASSGYVEEILNKNNINDIFDPLIISSNFRLRKPNKEIFDKLIFELGLKPGEILFVDDSIRNVTAAEKVGIKSFLFVSSDQFIEDLKSCGINVAESGK